MKSTVFTPAIIASGIGLFGVLGLSQSAIANTLAAHQAFYEMSLDDRESSSPIVGVSGKSAFVMQRECDGWISVEDYMIEFVSENGNSDRIFSHFESWEANAGDKYSFDVTEDSTFQGRKDFSGFADLSEASGNAIFLVEQDVTLELPSETYFPVNHMQEIINAANNGQTMLAATIFTGGEPDDALMKTNTIVGGWQQSKSEFEVLSEEGYWPVNVAYFKPTATTSEPEYEIKFALQPNGVVRNYVIKYGDFSIIATLTKLEGIETPVCS